MGIGMKLRGLDEDVKSMGMVETGKLMGSVSNSSRMIRLKITW